MGEIKLWTREHALTDSPVPARDRLAFLRQERMLQGGMPLVLSDGADCLIVQSEPQEAAWIWTSDRISDEGLSDLLVTLSAMREQTRLSRMVCKGKPARLIELAFAAEVALQKRLTVFRADMPIPYAASGALLPGTKIDPADASELIGLFSDENGAPFSAGEVRDLGLAFSRDPLSFAWSTDDGTIASIARLAPVGDRYTDIHTVVTRPELRNRGCAKAIVSALAIQVQTEGRVPMLYAQKDNAPAIAAYRAVGFTESASLRVLVLA